MNERDESRHPGTDGEAAEDPRLLDAVREYQTALDDGCRPNRADFVARFPDIAAELDECLDGLEFLHSAAPRLQPQEPLAAPVQADGTIGDFHLLHEIGRGGMGVVYEAVQISLGRRVALKVLPFAATLDARQLQRFENEARAAAHLHHTNIVPVFAVGCERSVHYYAMQLIDGRTLAAVIDARRRTSKPAAPDAETRARAGSATQEQVESKRFFHLAANLGVQAAEALEYAHQMGVVHRDVKPANLLLDGRGNLWVTDFGLARVQSSPAITAPGETVGTLRYMSPEQAAGKPVIDPRSDVYSLGATLYELLTNQPAFPARDRQQCLRQILDEEPVALHRLNKAVPFELETIVLKAMSKLPEDRYGTAKELADDLRRYLEDRPVQARPPNLGERTLKWARRHRRVVVAALLGLAASVLVLAATTWLVSRAETRALASCEELKKEQARAVAAYDELKKEQERTKEALEQEAAQRNRAESNYLEARKFLDFLTRFGVEELAGKPEFEELRRKLLIELKDYYEEFIVRSGDDPAVTDELLEAKFQVANILEELGEKAKARAAFDKAMREQAAGSRGKPGFSLGGIFGPPRGLIQLPLLVQPAVQKDLKLSAEQAAMVARQMEIWRNKPTDKALAAADKVVADMLKPAQTERLKQIVRQSRGPQALLDAETAKALKLTEKQKRDIFAAMLSPLAHSLVRGEHGERDEHGERGHRPEPERGRRPEMDGKQVNEKVLKVLTREQREQWKEMLGAPFHGDVRLAPPHGDR